ncbi:Uncharacterised protein [Xylophilus ampelinus]|nr:Uncharacterised protein [Xylophilus ampelinus]
MKFIHLLAATTLALIGPVAGAAQRCPAGDSGCTIDNGADKIRDRVNEGARKVINNSNPEGRAKEVRETVKDCVKCGMDAVKDGADKIKGQ